MSVDSLELCPCRPLPRSGFSPLETVYCLHFLWGSGLVTHNFLSFLNRVIFVSFWSVTDFTSPSRMFVFGGSHSTFPHPGQFSQESFILFTVFISVVLHTFTNLFIFSITPQVQERLPKRIRAVWLCLYFLRHLYVAMFCHSALPGSYLRRLQDNFLLCLLVMIKWGNSKMRLIKKPS